MRLMGDTEQKARVELQHCKLLEKTIDEACFQMMGVRQLLALTCAFSMCCVSRHGVGSCQVWSLCSRVFPCILGLIGHVRVEPACIKRRLVDTFCEYVTSVFWKGHMLSILLRLPSSRTEQFAACQVCLSAQYLHVQLLTQQ